MSKKYLKWFYEQQKEGTERSDDFGITGKYLFFHKNPKILAKVAKEEIVNNVLDKEQEDIRSIFTMIKFESRSPKEVAQKLNITERKVRYHIGILTDKMQEALKRFLPLLILFFFKLPPEASSWYWFRLLMVAGSMSVSLKTTLIWVGPVLSHNGSTMMSATSGGWLS